MVLVRLIFCLLPGPGSEQVVQIAAVAQPVERVLGKDEVGGSNPPGGSTFPSE